MINKERVLTSVVVGLFFYIVAVLMDITFIGASVIGAIKGPYNIAFGVIGFIFFWINSVSHSSR